MRRESFDTSIAYSIKIILRREQCLKLGHILAHVGNLQMALKLAVVNEVFTRPEICSKHTTLIALLDRLREFVIGEKAFCSLSNSTFEHALQNDK